jgi:hypothetical protein
MKPGYIAYFHLELDHTPGACTVDMTHDTDTVHAADFAEPLRYISAGCTHIEAHISGTVVSERPDYRPPARTRATAGAPATLTSGEQRALPAGEQR